MSWNQQWKFSPPVAPAVTATGPIRSGNTCSYCLRSPGSTAADQYVTTGSYATSGTLPQLLVWTRYGNTDSYEDALQIRDGFGQCLTPTRLDVTAPTRD